MFHLPRQPFLQTLDLFPQLSDDGQAAPDGLPLLLQLIAVLTNLYQNKGQGEGREAGGGGGREVEREGGREGGGEGGWQVERGRGIGR